MFSPILAVMLIGQVLTQEIVGVEKPSDCIENPCVPPQSFSALRVDEGIYFECTCTSPFNGTNCKGEEELLDCIKNPCVPPQFFSGFTKYGDEYIDVNCACPPPYDGPDCTGVQVQVATTSEIRVKSGSRGGDNGATLFKCCVGHPFTVEEFLVIRAQSSGSEIGFSVRVNGTFLQGKDMKCADFATGYALGQALYSKDFEFDDQWVNPSPTGVESSMLTFYDVGDLERTGDSAFGPEDALLWLGNESTIYCRINLADLQDNLVDLDDL